jgi:RimJ/RimL family protein N-acetyltransferase
MTGVVQLRDVIEADIPIFFEQQRDPEAIRMVAFTRPGHPDPAAFAAKWAKILADDGTTKKTVLLDDQVAGNVLCFDYSGKPSVGYWIGKPFWGRGVATRALAEFLRIVTTRPLFAGVAKDNVASLRVLEKCGFTICGEGKAFADARGEEVEEWALELRAP